MICGECTERLAPSDFYDSNQATCKRCVRKRATDRNRRDPQQHREASRRWREREQQRADLLELVLRYVAVRHPTDFHDAVLDAEDELALPPGTALDIFHRKQRDFSQG